MDERPFGLERGEAMVAKQVAMRSTRDLIP